MHHALNHDAEIMFVQIPRFFTNDSDNTWHINSPTEKRGLINERKRLNDFINKDSFIWSRRRGLNASSTDYKSAALLLSYTGLVEQLYKIATIVKSFFSYCLLGGLFFSYHFDLMFNRTSYIFPGINPTSP